MSYAVAEALQGAVYRHLRADAALAALVGEAIYDALPSGQAPGTYVTLGEEQVRDRSDATGTGAEHVLSISVVSEGAGFAEAKSVAVAIGDALENAELVLSRGRLVALGFLRAEAKRTGHAGRTRRIELRFRARVEDN